MMEGETLGSLFGDQLNTVAACIVSDDDLVTVCKTFCDNSMIATTVVERRLGWTHDKAINALKKLLALDILEFELGDGKRYSVNSDNLKRFITEVGEAPKAGNDDAGVSHDAGDGISADTPAEPASEDAAPKTKLAAPLKGISPAKSHKPRKSACDTLDDMLASIAVMPKKHCFEGAEREAKIAETFERLVDVIEKLNSGLEALDKVSEKVKFSRTPASIVRIPPDDNGGLGGIVIKYRGFKLSGDWDPCMTQTWCDNKVEYVANWTRQRLQHAIDVAKLG